MSVLSVPLPFNGKHWVAIRRIDDMYYELDSKCSRPLVVGNSDADMLAFLTAKMANNAKTELLLVLTSDVSRAGSWKRSSDNISAKQTDS